MLRIAQKKQTGSYRVEKRGVLGWAFVSDPQSGDYPGFNDANAARSWVRDKTARRSDTNNRRWKVVSECNL